MRPVSHVRVPKYCCHKARGLAYVRLGAEVKYLGKFGTPESKAQYYSLVAQWMGTPQQAPAEALAPPVLPSMVAPGTQHADDRMTVREFCLAYLKYAEARYEKNRYSGIRNAFLEMDRLFQKSPIAEFGPKRLKEVRAVFVKRGLKRQIVNRRTKYIINGVRWAVSEELISGEVLHRLSAVEILRRGEAAIPESKKVMPVDEAIVMETIKHTSAEVAAMVRLQLLTGARSGEIVLMRAGDIDVTGDVWQYRPEHHKTAHHGHERVITMGPRAKANRPLEDWGKLLGDVPSATAILDRFLHHAEIISITGRSYRLKDRALDPAGAEKERSAKSEKPARAEKDEKAACLEPVK